MFQNVDAYAGDPILSLAEEFKKDPRAEKINLSIGLYYDEQGVTPQLQAVATAEEQLRALSQTASLYLPMEGLESYRLAVQELLFGKDHPVLKQRIVATIQSLGGSGALKIGADFLRRYFPDSEVWCSDPTWENHAAIFAGAGIKVNYYPYFDTKTKGVKFNEMLETFRKLPAKSIIVMHPCCHNPTGSDLTYEQWDQVVQIVKERELLPFLDIAYQGLGDGMEKDAYAIRAMANAGLPCLVSNSFSKIFSMYGERVGGLSVICDDEQTKERVLGQLKAGVRRVYSSPPSFGAQVVAKVLTDPALKAQWLTEVEHMRLRILEMRTVLVDALKTALPEKNFEYFLKQRGMFSYTGFSEKQVDRLRQEFAVYLVGNGRVCMAGVNHHNVARIAETFAAVNKS
ncbi:MULTISPECIES: amino acid aminotransferase [Photorhabdus]|uniref:Aminotransferase n=1 Tax=Photorhabdus kayaii TaxID=230088 RepID=A0ABX0B5H3_9GAMM|nr:MULTISPECIES: amino acid aminotransferase [Photorhabdus]MCC8373383.1 aspartate/tyrosine/aromatic aminotransferase [Photorhabdus bodei]MCC8464395.1 aspartate/tyrosine/aromatic aminotransferase [Photorhabdus bodei]NDL13459.1 aminotransferase class I/II-fold pyridoxal phosphate-dependent enzyme [Photorhabdus kayaii]NDL26758.1 aminotransferase class I/II-fold pyridoxal phosphate-dependent enzyme [Photorhabdus kayaii]RAX07909.1 aromatic amino acid aminotransferase [Photorhabdus sp. HUG-39]